MRITYLTNLFPAVSHTFILRELQELERRGYEIQRLSLRSADELVDTRDLEEATRTVNILELPKPRIIGLLLKGFMNRPMRVIRTGSFAFRLARRSGIRKTKMLAYLSEAIMLAELCGAFRSELIRIHFGTNGAVVARLCRRLGGPDYSIAYHGSGEFDDPGHWDIGGVVSESAFVTATSSFCSGQLKRWTPLEHWNKIRIVRCAVDPRFLERVPFPTSGTRMLCIVARLCAQKALPLLLEGFNAAIEAGVDLRLEVVGDGEMREEFETRIRDLGLENRIILHGSLSGKDVRSVIERSCGIVLPSFSEGLPVVLMEAMGLGRPAIATQIAGIPELVRPSENGWLIPSGSVSALVDVLIEFAKAPISELERLGANAHDAVSALHRVEHQVDSLDAAIRELGS